MAAKILSGETVDLSSLLELICSSIKLDREKGESQLRAIEFSQPTSTFLINWIVQKLDDPRGWEEIFGALTVAKILLLNASKEFLKDDAFLVKLQEHALECQRDPEFRVRIAGGNLMGALCKVYGLSSFHCFEPSVLQGVSDNLDRDADTQADQTARELELAKERDPNLSISSLSIFHDTAGWKHLETWMKALRQMVANLDPLTFAGVNREALVGILFKAIQHTNRFVRETGYGVLDTLIERNVCQPGHQQGGAANFLEVAEQLKIGLSDNWSQVRMAASRATRTFYDTQPPTGYSREQTYPILLPPMCLNRYYVAEGVRVYSQATWTRVTQGNGKALLTTYLKPTYDYYFRQADADNHAVREAACAALAETVQKLDPAPLQPHIESIVKTLLVCFSDQSWPVRDAACVALGTLARTFPSHLKSLGHLDLFSALFLRNLSDSIGSVREAAANAIAGVLGGLGDDDAALVKLYLDYCRDKLASVKQQASKSQGAQSGRVEGSGPGASHAVVALTGSAAHDAKHTDQTMYSCGSLAPKLLKGRQRGGCHDGLDQRPSEPWELADGAVRLIGYIGERAPSAFDDNLIDCVLDAIGFRDYTHYPYLLETACGLVDHLVKGLDKRRFKRHLDNLLLILSDAISCHQPLAVAAAEDALAKLSQSIGSNILQARVKSHEMPNVAANLANSLPPPIA